MILRESNPDLYFQASLIYLRLSYYQLAIESIDLAILNSGDNNFYVFQKIKILFVAKMFTECTNYIEDNIITLYTNSSLYIFSQILHYYQTSSGGSISSLKNLLIINHIPSVLADELNAFINTPNINLLENIINAQETGDYTRCIDYCVLLLGKDASNITVYLIKARCYCLLDQHDLGIATYREAITLQPNVASIYSELGNVMLDLKYYSKAIHYFQRALDLDAASPKLLVQLGEGYFLWKKYDSALIHFKKALVKTPGCNETLLDIANTYDQMNQPKKARKYYTKVLKLK